MAGDMDDLKDAMTKKKLVIGTDLTIKKLKLGKISKVYLSKNCTVEMKNDIERYSKLAKIEMVQLDKSNEELGVICKKPFYISVLGVLSGK